jgi:Holliday junction resolvasome RuvABC endonuclease subunit
VLRRFCTKPADGPLLTRMRYLVAEVFAAVEHADLVVIEGLSYGSHGSATRDLAGLWWMLADALSRRVRLYPHRRLAVVEPATLKLWATGSGRADKREVREHITRRWHLAAKISADEADALVLASMGLHHAGALPWAPTQAQARAIQTPSWDLEAA